MLYPPFYDPFKSYDDNYKEGPFGTFADGKVFEHSDRPQYDFLGHKVYLPFGIPAGPLLNAKFVKAALDKGFNVPVYKTVRSRSYPCHPLPNVLAVHIKDKLTSQMAQNTPLVGDSNYTSPLGITNSFGVPSMSPDVWQADLKDALSYVKEGQLVIGSFQGTGGGGVKAYISDWVTTARLMKETGVKVIEANLSCPNEGTANVLCLDLERTKAVLVAVKNEVGDLPLLIKGAYMPEEYLIRFVNELSPIVQGFSVINTIAASIVDDKGQQALPGNGRLRSGVCGAPIKWAGLEMVKRLNILREKMSLNYKIIGVGGVMSEKDYKLYRSSGSDVIMSATGAMWNPYLAQEIKSKLTL
ncbi:dihydroorotate oxidase [Candidatus Roizmanbacteria bacterium]|nr:dihydroorotate oxidase [Candidatus Roizmanbacteria bacterium]